MSTAGKVLIVFIMLLSIVWIILTAGVTQLNRNGNRELNELSKQAAQKAEDVRSTRRETAQVKDQTTVLGEKTDRDIAVLDARLVDAQQMSSSIKNRLLHVQYELASIQQTQTNAETDRTQRADELTAEKTHLANARAEVKNLQATDRNLRDQLQGLRKKFHETYDFNVAALGRH